MEFFTCIAKLKKLLPPTLAGGIKNAFIKNDTLYFVMENKALEFEANYKLKIGRASCRERVSSPV